MIRVLQIGKFFEPYKGGIELVSLNLAEALNNKEIICDILCFDHDENEPNESFDFNVFRAKSILRFGSICISLDFIKILKKIADNYDVIHLHLPNPMAHLALWICRPKAKIVLHWHSDIIRQKIGAYFYRPFMKRLIRKSSAIIGATVAHVDESDFTDQFGKKKFVIPYIFNHQALSSQQVDISAVEKIQKKFPDKKILFSIGRHVYYKGFDNLVLALKFLSDEYVVVIGGKGPDSEDLQKIIESNGLQDRVYLTGRLSDKELVDYLDASSIFVIPSTFRSEMFGMVQLEAFARSRPVIFTNIPRSGVPHVGKHKITGLKVPVNSSKAIASAVEAISIPGLHQDYCNNAYQWVKSEYDYKKLVKQHIQVYEKILKGKKS